ncbi:MAG: hypothetical protein ACRDZW_06565 [Acidimicrobiales bacterium]
MDLARLGTGERVVAGAGATLAVDLALLPWHRINLGIIVVPRTAVQWPQAPLGVLALVLVVALVGVSAAGPDSAWARRLRPRLAPASLAVVAVLAIKLMLATATLAYGAYAALALAAAVAYGAARIRRDAPAPTGG